MKYKVTDGWRGVAPLEDFLQAYDDIAEYVYELKNCVRRHDLIEMRDALLVEVENMRDALESIEDTDTLEQKKEG